MSKHKIFGLALIALLISGAAKSQLIVNGGTITIADSAAIIVQGNLTTTADIAGAGKIIMAGTTAQQLNTNGFDIPNLEINSTGSIALTSDAKISNSLDFTTGKIQLADYNLTLASAATVTGAGTGKFVETNGAGQLKKEVTTVGSCSLPVGTGVNYMPLQYVVSGSTIDAGAYVATRLVNGTHPNKPIRAIDNLSAFWKPAYAGINGGNINAVASYSDAVNGDEHLLNPLSWHGIDWSLTAGTVNTTTHTVTYNSVINGSDLYAMDKFLLMNSKVFLQGAYNASTGKMNDNLRQSPNLIPLSDPYRTAPYNTYFTHVNNPTVEVADAAVFNTQANDDNNIVDWIFLELRDTTNQLLQTRSAKRTIQSR